MRFVRDLSIPSFKKYSNTGNYHKTFFLHGISHTEAVILSDPRHEQTASIPRTVISFKFFPPRYSPRCFFSSLFSAKNTLVGFFFCCFFSWQLIGVKERRLSGGKVFVCLCITQLPAEVKYLWIKGGKVLAFRGSVVFLEQTGVTDWKGSIGDYIKSHSAKTSGFYVLLENTIFRSVSGWKSNPPVSLDL